MVRPLSGKVEAQCNLLPICLFFYPFIVLPGLFTGPDRVTHERVSLPGTPPDRCPGQARPRGFGMHPVEVVEKSGLGESDPPTG